MPAQTLKTWSWLFPTRCAIMAAPKVPLVSGKTITNIRELLEESDLLHLEKKIRRGQVTFAELCELEAVGPKPMDSEERNGYIELLRKLSPYTRDVERCIILGKMKNLAKAGLLGTPTEEPFIEGLDEPEFDPLAAFAASIGKSTAEPVAEPPAAVGA